MRLTNFDRSAFVAAVMLDVPSIDYSEIARVKLQKWAIDHLPPKLKPLYKEYGHMFKHDRLWSLPGNIGNVTIVGDDDAPVLRGMKADTAFWAEIEKVAADMKAQDAVQTALHSKVTGLINSCMTVKQLEERAPEFIKYLGKTTAEPNRTLPVVQNIVADLVKAGWPKDQKKPAARKAA